MGICRICFGSGTWAGCFLWHHESCEPRATLELTPTRHQLLDLDKHTPSSPTPKHQSPHP